MRVYDKRPFSLSEQVGKLGRKGMLFNNREKAEQFLNDVSYYRLRTYSYPFQDNSEGGDHLFVREDISFGDLKNLYEFDCGLRSLLFESIAKIEVSLRTRMTQIYSESEGNGHWFLNDELYRCDYEDIIDDIRYDVERSNEDFIEQYFNSYDQPDLPPSWMSFEVISFGTLSRLYQSLKMDVNKRRLAHSYGIVDVIVLENWLHAISNLRNCCAHHGRIWNRRFSVNMTLPYNTLRPFISRDALQNIRNNKIFTILTGIKFLLDAINPTNDFKDSLKRLLGRDVRLLSLRDMGFPTKWEQMPVWNN